MQTWNGRTGFTKKQNTTRITSRKMDGRVRIFDQPETWEGEITFDREDNAIEAYFARREQAWRDGLTVQPVTITETIEERDGSLSQYRYNGVTLTLSNGGEVSGDDKISLTVSWVATERVQVL